MNDPGAPGPTTDEVPGSSTGPGPSTDGDREGGGAGSAGRVLVWVRAVVAGLCLAGSVPPWGWWPLAFIGIALLDGLIADRSWRSRFGRTWVVAASWLYPATLWMYDLTAPGYVVAGALFACYVAAVVALTPGDERRRIVLPLTIALAEWARWSFPFGGVPLAHLAMSQVDTPLGATARLGGSLLVVVAVVVTGQALAAAVRGWWPGATAGPGRSLDRRSSLVGLGVVAALLVAAVVHPRAEPVRTAEVALVQGGGPQRTRASSLQEPVVLGRHVEATRSLEGPVDLVVWPENVVNPGRYLSQEDARDLVDQVAADTGAGVLAGWFFPVSDTATVNYHSTITPDGREIDRYDKVVIVPFGEYVPFRGLVERLNDEVPGRDVRRGTAEPVLDTPVGPVGVSISWEGFFERRARASVANGAQILANPTNGSSYWLTQVQTQQVASNQLRALENDRWVLQVAPTGLSAVIDPDGRVLQRTGISERAVLTATVEMREGRTLGSLVGFYPVTLAAVAALAATSGRDLVRRRSAPVSPG